MVDALLAAQGERLEQEERDWLSTHRCGGHLKPVFGAVPAGGDVGAGFLSAYGASAAWHVSAAHVAGVPHVHPRNLYLFAPLWHDGGAVGRGWLDGRVIKSLYWRDFAVGAGGALDFDLSRVAQ